MKETLAMVLRGWFGEQGGAAKVRVLYYEVLVGANTHFQEPVRDGGHASRIGFCYVNKIKLGTYLE
jgi:hypothetical protein